jgi:hypothetical protein
MILNKTKKASERYTVYRSGQGNFLDPKYYPTHQYCVVTGVNRGNGYQGYMSLTYALKNEMMPEEAIKNLIAFLIDKGYSQYLQEIGVI